MQLNNKILALVGLITAIMLLITSIQYNTLAKDYNILLDKAKPCIVTAKSEKVEDWGFINPNLEQLRQK